MGDVIGLIFYLFVCLAYFVFLLAVRSIVNLTGDVAFVHRMRDFLVATIVGCLSMALSMTPALLPATLNEIFGLLSIVFIAILGIVSIRLAPYFDKLENNRARYGKKASRWLRISGWLMATVILSFIGVFASLIADFYMWRLIKNERLNAAAK